MPDWRAYVAQKLPDLGLRPEVEREVVDELAAQLEDAYLGARRDGLEEREAQRYAEAEIPDWAELARTIGRTKRSGKAAPPPPRLPLFDAAWQHLWQAARALRRQPGFALLAVLTLALGIGAATAVFSIVHGVLLQPLPYGDPDRLVRLRADIEGMRGAVSLSAPELVDLRARTTLFQSLDGFWFGNAALRAGGELERVTWGWATAGLFETLGVKPVLGRGFVAGDDQGRVAAVAVISHELWQSRFGGDPGVLGRALELEDQNLTIVGVLGPGFNVLGNGNAIQAADVWTPSNYWTARGTRWLRVLGRLKAGVTVAQAQQELDAVSSRLAREHKEYANTGLRFTAHRLLDDHVAKARPGLWVLLGAVSFVLLIACANVANLMLARAAAREREIAVRAALGAGRGRLFSQVIAEALLLAGLGGVAGVALAYWLIRLLLYVRPAGLPRLEAIALHPPVLAAALLAAALTALFFGLTPAWQAARLDLVHALRGGARVAPATGLRRGLVVAEVALSVMLLAGAGLLIRTFVRLQGLDLGFSTEAVQTFYVPLSARTFQAPEKRVAFYRDYCRELAALPGAASCGAISRVPLQGTYLTAAYAYNAPTRANWGTLAANYATVTPGFFETVGARLAAGRFPTAEDSQPGRRAVVIDESLARQAWPGQNPIGRPLTVAMDMSSRESGVFEVVGVVAPLKMRAERGNEMPQIYLPHGSAALAQDFELGVVVRGSIPAPALARAARDLAQKLASGRPVHSFAPLSEYAARVSADVRFAMLAIGLFGLAAVVLSLVGIYGVISYLAEQRRREWGIRLALGASPRDLRQRVLRQALGLAAAGAALGVGGALATTRFLAGWLYGVAPGDPVTLASAAALLLVAAAFASAVPARRCSRLNPASVLRAD